MCKIKIPGTRKLFESRRHNSLELAKDHQSSLVTEFRLYMVHILCRNKSWLVGLGLVVPFPAF